MGAAPGSCKKKPDGRARHPSASVCRKGTAPPLSREKGAGGFPSGRQVREALRKSLRESGLPAYGGILSWRDAHGAAEPPGPHLSHTGAKLGDTILGGPTFTEMRLVAYLPLRSTPPPKSREKGRVT